METSCNGDKLPLENLLTGRVDVTVTMGDSQRNGVERDFLLEDELVAVLPAEHPLVHREYLAAEDFREETLLGISSILERGQEFDHLFGPSGAAPERFLSAGNAQFVCALVANDTGLGILGKWAASYDIRKYGLKTVRLTRAGLKVNWHAAFAESGTQRGETAALIRVVDPQGRREGERLLPGVAWNEDAYEAAEGADLVVILTEWNEFRALDLSKLASTMTRPRMADLRNIYSAEDVFKAGFTAYDCIGRDKILPSEAEAHKRIAS